jgi:hypothetical protein
MLPVDAVVRLLVYGCTTEALIMTKSVSFGLDRSSNEIRAADGRK